MPFLRVRVFNFEKEQQPSLPPCPSLTTRPKPEAEVDSHPSLFSPLPLQPSFPCSWPAPLQGLPSNLCPQQGCTGVTNCHLANHSGLPGDQTPACSPCTVSALQGQNYRHVSFAAQAWWHTKSRSIKADTGWLLRADWSGRLANHL